VYGYRTSVGTYTLTISCFNNGAIGLPSCGTQATALLLNNRGITAVPAGSFTSTFGNVVTL
jgi:hypothetical protein